MPKGLTTSTITTPRPRKNESEAVADPTMDSLQLLLREAGRYPLLKPSEEIELAKRIESELTTKLGHEPSDEEIADAADLPLADVIEIRKADRAVVSLDKPVGDDGDTSFGDLLALETPAVDEEVHEALRSETLLNAI